MVILRNLSNWLNLRPQGVLSLRRLSDFKPGKLVNRMASLRDHREAMKRKMIQTENVDFRKSMKCVSG